MADPLLLGVREAAKRLGVGRDSCYALLRQGRLRAVRIGRRLLVPAGELQAFVARELARTGEPERTGGEGVEG